MIRPMLLAVLLGFAMPCFTADDLKVAQLEQDVRDLQRQVQALSRQIEGQRQPALQVPAQGPRQDAAHASAQTPGWVDAVRWQRVQPGMDELEVVQLLGSPTSMRMEAGAKVLFYAMEIGSSGYLSGSVKIQDRKVMSVQKPTLQ